MCILSIYFVHSKLHTHDTQDQQASAYNIVPKNSNIPCPCHQGKAHFVTNIGLCPSVLLNKHSAVWSGPPIQ